MAMIMKKIGKIGVNMIYVTGGSRAQRKYAQSLAEFCLKKLLPRHKTIIVDINLCRVANGSVGNCLPTSDFNKPREFEIEVDCRMKLRDLLTTIAHEMVHVKQYVRKEIPIVFPDDGKYYEWPWEIEAFGREWGLFRTWTEQERISHKKWARLV